MVSNMLPEGYKKEELNEKDKSFVNGMEHLCAEIDSIVDNYDLDDDSLIDKMKAEIIKDFVEHLKICLGIEIDEVIVSMLDGYPEEEE